MEALRIIFSCTNFIPLFLSQLTRGSPINMNQDEPGGPLCLPRDDQEQTVPFIIFQRAPDASKLTAGLAFE